jgi:hypothetical protein
MGERRNGVRREGRVLGERKRSWERGKGVGRKGTVLGER